jgi:hypothetical protein
MERSRQFTAAAAVCIILLSIYSPSSGKIIYVDDDANAPGDGSSWRTAYKYLQDALADAKAAEKPVEIRVAQGVYRPDRSAEQPEGTRDRWATFRLLDRVTTRGGFAGVGAPDPNARDVGLYPSILSGDLAGNDIPLVNPLDAQGEPTRADNCHHVVTWDEHYTKLIGLTTTLDGFVITGGYAFRYKASGAVPDETTPPEHRGAGLYVFGPREQTTAMAVRDCTFTDNYAEATGGAVYCYYMGELTFRGCVFSRNGTHQRAAALCGTYSKVQLDNCQFKYNQVEGACGAVYVGLCDTTFTNCVLEENTAGSVGGLMVGQGAVRLSRCDLIRNRAEFGSAGAVLVDSGTHAQFSDCRFVSNMAPGRGGAVMTWSGATTTLTNCWFGGNTGGTGGAIWKHFGELHVFNCTAIGNTAPQGSFLFDFTERGDGTYPPGFTEISNSIISDSGSPIWNNHGAITVAYTDLASGWASVHDPDQMTTQGPGNIEVDPCFAYPGYWDPNGTPEDPNDDFFVEGDYHLRSQAGRWDPVTETWVKDDVTSSCVDAGDPNSPIGQEPFPNGGRVNMGAYGGTAEASMSYLAEAKVIYVDDDAPAPGDGSSWQTAYKYLQDALADAQTADKPVEIRVAQGIYKPDRSAAHPQGTGEQSKEWYFRVTDDMSLIGGYAGLSGLDPNARDIKVYDTVLSGDLLGNDAPATDPATLMKDPTRSDNMRVMWVSTNGGHVWLDGCTITGGSGGALVAAGPVGYTDRDVNVTVSNCTFRGNRGLWTDTPVAGAVHTIWRGLRLVRCVFEGNAGPMGGAVLASHAILDSCQFIGNYASDGGAAYLEHGALTNCEFIENRAVNGGAVYLDASSSDTATMVGCIFRGNLALGGSGGAIVCYADLDLVDCLFTANEAFDSGGACFQADSTVILANCVLVGNRAGQDGGAWEAGWQAHLKAVNCTLPDNRSPAGSFLMVRHYEQASSTSIIIWNCILPEGSDSIRSTDVPVRLAYTCVGRGGRSLDATDNCLIWGPGNIEADPCFADPGYWDPNGTPEDPNDDFFVEGDYHLKSQAGRWDPAAGSWVVDDVTSPCIDAGDPNSPIGDEPFPNGGRVNMGAYGGTAEASMSYFDGPVCTTIIAGDINGDGRVDAKDLAILARHRLQAQGQ